MKMVLRIFMGLGRRKFRPTKACSRSLEKHYKIRLSKTRYLLNIDLINLAKQKQSYVFTHLRVYNKRLLVEMIQRAL